MQYTARSALYIYLYSIMHHISVQLDSQFLSLLGLNKNN